MTNRRHRPLIIGNWKMNGLRADLATIAAIDRGMAAIDRVEAVICPPHTLVAAAAGAVGHIAIGGQDCHAEISGPYTGAVSAAMLADAGARYVIVGHSERRRANMENDALVADKVRAALHENLVPVVCVGEMARDRSAVLLERQVLRQLMASLPSLTGRSADLEIVIAYEPVWAIGSKSAPPLDHVRGMIEAIRLGFECAAPQMRTGVRILYGGAVDAANAPSIIRLTGADGLLLGRASLETTSFLAVARACEAE